jgi:tetratricopeptide (TPR) repeat protein
MENEAQAAGLRLEPRESGGVWDLNELQIEDVHESLTGAWKLMEYLPVTRLSFQTAEETTGQEDSQCLSLYSYLFFRMPHRGAGRVIAPGQRIHISVAFKNPSYFPRAEFLLANSIKWDSFVGGMIESNDFDWALGFGEQVELDLFDASFATQAINNLNNIWGKGDHHGGTPGVEADESYWMNRLAFMAPSGRLAEQYVLGLGSGPSGHTLGQIRSGVALFQKLEDHYPGTFERDVAALLEQEGDLLFSLEQMDTALDIYRKAEMFWQNRAAKEKARLKDHEKVAGCRRNISRCCHNLKQHQDELEADQSIVDLYRKLPDNDPIITKHLAQSLVTLGTDLSNLGRHEDALQADKEAVDLYQKSMLTDPSITRKFAWSLLNLGIDLRQMGLHQDALRADQEAVEISRKMMKTDPSVTTWLAWSLHCLGVDYSNLGRHESALSTAEEVVEIRRKLVETDPTGTRALAGSLFHLGFKLRSLGRHREGLKADEEATELCRRITETDPKGLASLADCLKNLGLDLNAVGRNQDAVQAGEEAAKILHELPNRTVEVELCLRITQKILVVHLRVLDRNEDASRIDKEADEILRKLGETDPGATAESFHGLAVDLRSIGHRKDALQAEESAVALYRKIPQMAPGLFINALESLAKNLRALGREKDAVKTDAEVANLKSSSIQGPNPLTDAAVSSR